MSDSSNSTGSSGSSTNSWTLLSPEEAAIENVGPVDDGTESLGDAPSLSEEVADPESQPPVIHDIVTTSPSDNEPQGAMPFVTTIDLEAHLDVPAAQLNIPAVEISAADSKESCTEITDPAEPVLDTVADSGLVPACLSAEGVALSAEAEVNVPMETVTATDAPSHVEADISFVPKGTDPPRSAPESLVTEHLPAAETIGPSETEADVEDEAEKLCDIIDDGEDEEEPPCSFDDGLRRRNVSSFEAPRPRTSDEEEDEDEVEFKLPETKEEKSWLSTNKCIVGALVLLFLGSLFFSGDFDPSELTENQDGLSDDPQDMKELLDELTQENQQITELEAQLQTKKEELDSQMEAVAASRGDDEKADLEKENARLKVELSILPELKKELESLRVRVTELGKLTANAETLPPASGLSSAPEDVQGFHQPAGAERKKDPNLKQELKRQKVLLEESKKRLDGMNKDGGDGQRVRKSLEGIQKKLSEQVERWEKTKSQGSKWRGNDGKHKEREQWKKERKHKDEKKEKEWKPQKENSHKEAWRKHQDEWERKKGERRMDREERRKEKPWHSRQDKNPHHHRQPHQHHKDFWKDQEQKLHRNVRPQLGCTSVEDCATREGLYPVELSEFELLLEGYLSKLEGSSNESKDKIRKLTADFFEDGVFIHDRVRFGDFAEDVADVLEDMVDVLERGGQEDSLEEEMEEFEREALWKFAV
uniref:Pre-B-cell leukemia homeobox interacting protein 1a n=1 Tax=Iconisemion striatum TaxID=60296 RepID=A0A1A7WD48_9TELE